MMMMIIMMLMMMTMYGAVSLFPLPERGMNPHARTLKDHEIGVITELFFIIHPVICIV